MVHGAIIGVSNGVAAIFVRAREARRAGISDSPTTVTVVDGRGRQRSVELSRPTDGGIIVRVSAAARRALEASYGITIPGGSWTMSEEPEVVLPREAVDAVCRAVLLAQSQGVDALGCGVTVTPLVSAIAGAGGEDAKRLIRASHPSVMRQLTPVASDPASAEASE